MARVEIRLGDDEKDRLVKEAVAEGRSLSDLIRGRVLGETQAVVAEAQTVAENHERRIARLEEMAGL